MRLLCTFVLAAVCAAAQPSPLPRLDFGARLEPRGAIQHGAGQSAGSFAAYWGAMPDGRKPQVYMVYIALKDLKPHWVDGLRDALRQYPDDVFLIPQIGLSMTSGGAAYDVEVAEGVYDRQIGYLIAGLRKLATPAYIRIGYECNGVSWNGYHPGPFQDAFRRIAARIREADLEVATVWNVAIDGSRDFFAWYPGGDDVDWFAINVFSGRHFADADTAGFLDAANALGKPVMLGELTPKGVGAQDGERSWNEWFAPLFDLMASRPEIKQFNYINWEWSYWANLLGTNWGDWGDARLETETASAVRERYAEVLSDPVFAHAGGEAEFRRATADGTDGEAPAEVADVSAETVAGGVRLTWSAAEDPSGIARYFVYRDGARVDVTLDTSYVDRGVPLGSHSYRVAAMDRAGNLSAEAAEPAVVEVREVERIVNGDFDAGEEEEDALAGWRFETFDARAQAVADVDEQAARIRIERSTGTNWHIQLRQFLPLTEGHDYEIRFTARASAAVNVPVAVQETGGANAIHLFRTANLGTDAMEFRYTLRAPRDGNAALSFFLGAVPGGTSIWVDRVSAIETRAP